jgi:hypothetical protein
MTLARMVIGEIFIAILVIGVVYAAVSPALQPIIFPKIQTPWFNQGNRVTDSYSLVKGTSVPHNISYVDLNATVKFGAISLVFSNDPTLALGATFDRAENASQLGTSRTTDGQVLQVSIYGEAGLLNLTLGTSYQYNGSLNMRIGGVTMTIGQYSNISKLSVRVEYIGGIILDIKDSASFERLDLSLNLGGIQLNSDANHILKDATINMNIDIGGAALGLGINTDLIGASLEANVDIGAITVNTDKFTGTTSTNHCSVKTAGYDHAAKKIDINAQIGLGGLTLQPTTQTLPGAYT